MKNKVNWKHDLILNKCKWKKILHLWATDNPYTEERYKKKELLHQKIMEVTNDVIWLDFSKEKINLLKEKGINNIIYGDLIKGEYEKEIWNNFDYIIFWDVIEHLDNPWLALQNIKKFMNKNTILILTTPNVFSYTNIVWILTWKEIVHNDHVFWPSQKTMSKLIMFNGFYINKFLYCLTGSTKNIKTFKWKIFHKLILNIKQHLCPVLYYEIKKIEK